MNIWKRAYLHTYRKKGKTALMFFILLIVSTLILTCLAIQSATDTAALNIRKSLMGGYTINAKRAETLLDKSTVSKILEIPGMSSNYNLRSYYYAEYRNVNEKKLVTKKVDGIQAGKGHEYAGKMVSSTHSEMDTYFIEAGFKLKEGRHIAPDDKNAILVSDEFAKINGLKLGDHIVLGGIDAKNQIKVEIVGVFTPPNNAEVSTMTPQEDLHENVAFTDHATYSLLSFGKEGDRYQYGDFYVDDPADLDSIMAKVKEIPNMNWEACVFTKNDAEYQNAKTELETLQNLVTTIIFILIAITIIMLTLILFLWIRNRIREIGMLLAMGLSKVNIMMQHIAEILLIAVFAFALSFGTSTLIAQKVGDTLSNQTMSDNQVTENNLTDGTSNKEKTNQSLSLVSVDVEVSVSDLLLVYVIGTGMILLSITFASYPIVRMKPKDILTKMN